MQYNKIKLDSFCVSGKEVITTNAENKFGEVWADFYQTYAGGQPVAVYTNYESDANGKFAFLVGVKTNVNEDARAFDGGNYLQFHLSDRSQILQCWQYIWSNELNRAYLADFEFYNEDGSVDIFISIKQGGFGKMIESRCGIKCSECAYKEQVGCKGCVNIDKPFWGESCMVKSCCEGKGMKNCGFCKDFACDTLTSFAYDKAQGDNGKRIEHCKELREDGIHNTK